VAENHSLSGGLTMTIVRWDPFRNLTTLQDRINRLFEDAFPNKTESDEDAVCSWRPLVDIYETEAGIVIQADLPGVEKEKVFVEVKDNVLTIQGERAQETAASDDKYYRRERTCGLFQRSFTLRTQIAPEKIKATFKNGVLKVEIPHPKEDRTKQITVKVE
jgi:HSP20 family protein